MIICDKSKGCLNNHIKCEACGAMADIYNHYPFYKSKDEIDQDTASMIISEFFDAVYSDYDMCGDPILCIELEDFEKIRKKYLD